MTESQRAKVEQLEKKLRKFEEARADYEEKRETRMREFELRSEQRTWKDRSEYLTAKKIKELRSKEREDGDMDMSQWRERLTDDLDRLSREYELRKTIAERVKNANRAVDPIPAVGDVMQTETIQLLQERETREAKRVEEEEEDLRRLKDVEEAHRKMALEKERKRVQERLKREERQRRLKSEIINVL